MFVPPSIYSIGKNATVIFTAIFSVFYLKKRLLWHQIVGIVIIMVGFLSVSFSSIFYEESNPHHHSFDFMSIVGILSLFLSLVFQGYCYCFEEHLFDVYDINVAHLLGLESMMGAIVSTGIFLITMNITCTHPEFCNSEVAQKIDSPPEAIYDLKYNYAWGYFILTMFSIMIFNLLGVFVTKHSGAVFRVVLDTLRTIVIWIISLLVGFEKLTPFGKLGLELTGFVLLIFGNLVYNELVVLRFCGLAKDVKKKKAEAGDSEYQAFGSGNDDLSQE